MRTQNDHRKMITKNDDRKIITKNYIITFTTHMITNMIIKPALVAQCVKGLLPW